MTVVKEGDKVLVIEAGDDAPTLKEIAHADLVVYAETRKVVKSRFGALGMLTEAELQKAREVAVRT